MGRKTRGPWICLYYELFDKSKWSEYEAMILEGKRTKSQVRAAMDFALSSVVRLYLALGRTDNGEIDYRNRGQRIQLEKWMTMKGDELLETLNRMAECSIINREFWCELNIIKTTNSTEQAAARTSRMEKSNKANEAKRRKESEAAQDAPTR